MLTTRSTALELTWAETSWRRFAAEVRVLEEIGHACYDAYSWRTLARISAQGSTI